MNYCDVCAKRKAAYIQDEKRVCLVCVDSLNRLKIAAACTDCMKKPWAIRQTYVGAQDANFCRECYADRHEGNVDRIIDLAYNYHPDTASLVLTGTMGIGKTSACSQWVGDRLREGRDVYYYTDDLAPKDQRELFNNHQPTFYRSYLRPTSNREKLGELYEMNHQQAPVSDLLEKLQHKGFDAGAIAIDNIDRLAARRVDDAYVLANRCLELAIPFCFTRSMNLNTYERFPQFRGSRYLHAISGMDFVASYNREKS